MNFGASNSEENVFLAMNQQAAPVFKAATAVLPAPMGFSQLSGPPVPTMLGMPLRSDPFTKTPFQVHDQFASPKTVPQQMNVDEGFPVFSGETNNVFGLVSSDEPNVFFMRIQRALEFAADVDHYRVDGEANLIRGRYFGNLDNAEYEARVFAFSGSSGRSYVEFSRWCGDGWAFSRFVTKILAEFGENVFSRPELPPIPAGYGQGPATADDLVALLDDVERSFQDISEHAAAELAMQTQSVDAQRMCDEIEGFCPRVLEIVSESSNCAIVRSLLICLRNMVSCDGLTKRIVRQHREVLHAVGQKWESNQSMCGGLFKIAPSRQVTNHVEELLAA